MLFPRLSIAKVLESRHPLILESRHPFKFADVENLSVYDFIVTKNWKGVATGQTVSILFNATWGDNHVPGSHFLVVSPQQISDMYWTPLCGNSIDLEWARKNGDLELLEKVIGIGYQIRIAAHEGLCR